MGIFFAIVASLFASFNNYSQRKSIDVGGKSDGFIIFQLLTSFCILLILNPLLGGSFDLSKEVLLLGMGGGLFLAALTWSIGKALERGPPGLTFAILCSASVFPGFFFFLCFGPSCGYGYSLLNGLGALFVIIGLFWAARKKGEEKNPLWMIFAFLAFLIHALFMGYLALWALVLRKGHALFEGINITEAQQLWFMPILLMTAALCQLILYFRNEGGFKLPSLREMRYGIQGGICHGLCTYFLILAPQRAESWEHAMLFPVYAVLMIVVCNLWAQILYKERVNWKAQAVAFSGVILGTLGS